MTTSNHVLVGSLIAVTIKQPLLVLPLAFASHYALDALPHFGYAGAGYGEALKHKLTFVMEGFGLVGLIILLRSVDFSVWLVSAAAVLAVLPDIEWPYRYFFFERLGLKPPETFTARFHHRIQWCERWWGMYVEICFFAVVYTLFHKHF